MKKYCEACERIVETKIIKQKEHFKVCGEDIETEAEVLTCAVCGEELYCEELDNETLLKAYNEYRKRHKLLFPEEIRNIRLQYGLTQRGFAKLLNWGDKTIHRYENGSIQDKAHNSLLMFLREPQYMEYYLTNNEIDITSKKKEELLDRIKQLESGVTLYDEKQLIDHMLYKEPSVDNGFRSFDYKRFCAMVAYFAKISSELTEEKLVNLMNYSDMISYREQGVSISGTQYIRRSNGPVPQKFNTLFDILEEEGIAHIQIEFDSGYEKHKIVLDCEYQGYEEILSKNELMVMERVYKKFENYKAQDISNCSLNEAGCQSTKNGETISYKYAEELQF